MEPEKVLDLGSKYSKKDLSSLLDQPNLSFVREGIFNCKNSSSSLFFVDLEKKDKEKKFHFNDFFEGDFFHWDSQTTQHINTPKIQEIVNGDRTPHLMIRITPKIKNVDDKNGYLFLDLNFKFNLLLASQMSVIKIHLISII